MSVRKSYLRRPAKIRMFLVVSVVLLAVFTLSFGREYISNLQVQREIARLEADRVFLESERATRLLRLQKLSSEYYLEKQAREKHGLAASGEQVYIIKDDENAVRNEIGVPQAPPEPPSIPRQWFDFFFGGNAYEEGARD